jgi:hypothetical protein
MRPGTRGKETLLETQDLKPSLYIKTAVIYQELTLQF